MDRAAATLLPDCTNMRERMRSLLVFKDASSADLVLAVDQTGHVVCVNASVMTFDVRH